MEVGGMLPRPRVLARSTLLQSVGAVTRECPHVRKLLVAPDVNFGRELLVTLARDTGGWVGWEAATLRTVADALAFVPLADRSLTVAVDVEIAALVDTALARVSDRGLVSRPFAELGRSHGFRRALRDTLLEVRMAGLSPAEVRRGTLPGTSAHDLPPVLAEYEGLLAERCLADAAAVFRVALDAFDDEADVVLPAIVALVPGLAMRGLPGEFLTRLMARGARILDADRPVALAVPPHVLTHGDESTAKSLLAWVAAHPAQGQQVPAPDPSLVTCDVFAAVTPSEELRELCRRVVAEGWRWDEVEIVATDPDSYGIALDALTQRLGIGATMLQGIPFARTRLGRALDRWFAWLSDGLPADILRQALEAGELSVAEAELPSTALARELRALRIGWGRARYVAALARLRAGERVAELRRRDDESDDEHAARCAARARVGAELTRFLEALLAATPQVPERGSDTPVPASAPALARATLRWLALVPVHGAPEGQAMERLRTRLEAVAALAERETGFGSALAALRESLADLRAWPMVTSDRKPWSASGGMLHLTDLAHAGTTGRPRTFVVGLDADRTGGPVRQDPLLPDGARRAIGALGLPNAGERREGWSFGMAAALAALRGRVTLSYATSGALDGREAGASPLLLQAWRLLRGDASLSYGALREALRPPASPVPARDSEGRLAGIALLDQRDVWLDALADGPLLLDGSAATIKAFPLLAGGLRAHELSRGEALTAYHGLVPAAGAVLDPVARGREISPSSLEKLAACGLAWFYQYALAVRPPVDPEYDADAWLDARGRGDLLHEVFERFTREYQPRQDAIVEEVARERMLAIVEERIAAWRVDVPPPGEIVFETEAAEIRRSALAFLAMEREVRAGGAGGSWRSFEVEFGGGAGVTRYTLLGGDTLPIRGKADRVDLLPDGTLRVVDYKTGRPDKYRHSPRGGAFNGGRQLQPALYAAAIAQVEGGRVSRFEYRFPTERGENEIVAYGERELEGARLIVEGLVEQVRGGAFVPTTDARDCGYCDFQPVCRAGGDAFGGTASPRAQWAKTFAPSLPAYVPILTRRGVAPEGGR